MPNRLLHQNDSAFTFIEKCRGCHASAERLRPVLEMAPMPLAGMFCETAGEAAEAPVFPLTWVHCGQCGLVQVREDISDSTLFARYNYASSTVPGLVRHFESYADVLAIRYRGRRIRFLEIGCNDGVLLRRLPKDWELLGCDPSDVASSHARNGAPYQLISRPFSLATVEGSFLAGTVDVISGSNCLAHISDLKEVFEAAWTALLPGGDFWIEVHDLAALLRGGQWDTIYHEHKVEWSEASMIRCVAAAGFVHAETVRTPMHGGALRVRFTKGLPTALTGDEAAPDAGLHALRAAYDQRYETAAARRLRELQNSGMRISAYGASGRANVYLNQLPELRFDYIVDEAPLRMNKFIPRAGTPIVAPAALEARPAAACLVTAWNYRDDIVRKNPAHKGEWLTAFDF